MGRGAAEGVHAAIAFPMRLGLLGCSRSWLRIHREGREVEGSGHGTKQEACFGM